MTEPLLQDPEMTWGVLSFVSPSEDTETGFEIQAFSETEFGDPMPVIETMPSLLVDGALAATTRFENREVIVYLRVSANDGEKAAQGEAELFKQRLLEQPPPLIWTPPMGLSAPVAFDVVAADMRRDYNAGERWDFEEVVRGFRYYVLTLTCLPFARALESTVEEALPVPADPDTEDRDVIDDCTSATGWTLETNGGSPTGPTVVGGQAIEATAFIDNANDNLRLVRTGAIVVPTDYYLAVDVKTTGWAPGRMRARLDGIYVDPIAQTVDGESGSTRLFFADVGSITELAILKDYDVGSKGGVGTAGTASLTVYNVATTDTLGASTTTTSRQQSRLVTVLGSAPTQAQIRLYDATPDDLGTDILVYTSRNIDWRPNLRRWIDTSPAPTSDAALVSGARHPLTTATTFLIPSQLLTAGSYALLARLNVSVAGTVTWSAQMATAGGATNVVGSSVIVSGTVDVAATVGYEVIDLAALVLPVVDVESESYSVKLTITGTASMLLDEAWLFSLDDGVLTWLKDDEEMDWLEIRSPELGAARPSVWGGRNALGSGATCVDWKCRSFGPHQFDPGVMQIFTVAPATLISQCEIEFFPRAGWHVQGAETS